MNNTGSSTLAITPNFWTRLKLAIEEAAMSYEERLERRVRLLEADVERLQAGHNQVVDIGATKK